MAIGVWSRMRHLLQRLSEKIMLGEVDVSLLSLNK